MVDDRKYINELNVCCQWLDMEFKMQEGKYISSFNLKALNRKSDYANGMNIFFETAYINEWKQLIWLRGIYI